MLMWCGESAIAVLRLRFKIGLLLLLLSGPCFARVAVFVSFSMPEESLKQWVMQAQKAHAQVYIRGLQDNSFKKTLNKTANLLGNTGGFLLDPKMFAKYHIDKVPAVVFIEEDETTSRVYGDMGLLAAAEAVLARTKSKAAAEVVRLLKT